MTTLPNERINLLNEHEVSQVLGVSVATVRRWRLLRQGPKYLKVVKAVRYRHEDLAAWLASRPTGGFEPPSGTSESTGPR
jgi:predicted DNA-binding transcriptional regulator AlpA